MTRIIFGFVLLLAISVSSISAQDPAAQYPPGQYPAAQDPASQDPGGQAEPEYDPAHGVARISLLNGDVSLRRGDSGDVVAAAVNAPLVSQDRLLTSSSSRAEVQLDRSNILRVGSNSEVRLNDVEYTRFQLQLAIGTITFRVLGNSQLQGEIDTPSVAVRPIRPGVYRITVREDGSTEITVREGEAEIASQRGSEHLAAGNTMLARGNASDPEFQVVAALGLDDWDRWSQNRDQEITRARSTQYVAPDVVGAEDLDQYGHWQTYPEYGNVWVPTVAPGWAPYQAGRWVWEDFYGWTWVSYDPWGWAPYHYGRWFHASFGWGWYPGPIYGRHYWSPALVGFFGFGGHGGFGFGFGNVGWVPLAPFEPFHPWWGRGYYGGFSRGFINNTRIVNNVNITNIYRNARFTNGVTTVSANDFGRHTGRFVGMNGSSIRDAGLVRGVLPVAPDRSSLRLSDRQVRANAFPQRNVNFYSSRSGPSSTQRVPFEQQQRAMANFSTGSTGRNSGQQFGGRAGFSQAPAGRQAASEAGHGWSRFGAPIHGSVADAPRQVSGQSSPGSGNPGYRGSFQQSQPSGRSNVDGSSWRRFGEPSGAPSVSNSGGRYQAAPESSRPQSSSGSWGRFGGTSSNQAIPSRPAQQYSSPYGSSSRWSGGGNSGGEAVRISPPMVHERSTQGNTGYGGGASYRSAPSYNSAPTYNGGGRGSYRNSAPSYSAPRSSGGGGGGAHYNSGGGGGGRGSSGSSGEHGGGRRR